MIRNNEKISEREFTQSPICWSTIEINEVLPRMTATQQDIAMFYIHIARRVYMDAWETIKSQKEEDEQQYTIYDDMGYPEHEPYTLPAFYYTDENLALNYEWLRWADEQGLFTCDIPVADIARAIHYTGKTINLIDDILVMFSRFDVRLESNGGTVHLVQEHEIVGTQRRRIVHARFSRNAIDSLLRREYLSVATGKIAVRSFMGVRLWDHVVLSSRYSKCLFRYVVQWGQLGRTPAIKFEDEKKKRDIYWAFGIPRTMRTSDIMTRVIEPACREVSELLGATITAVPEYDMRVGRKLKSVKFTFIAGIYENYEKHGKLADSRVSETWNRRDMIATALGSVRNHKELYKD